MRTHQLSDSEHQNRYASEITGARRAGDDQFQAWFNKSRDVRQSIVRGYWDLSSHILTPEVCRYMDHPEDKVSLEIGYGGGRILNAACDFFSHAVGIDIHTEREAVEAFLRSQGKQNFRLIQTQGRTIDVDSASIDFVYSFIVLQHLPNYEVLESYIKETYRCLKPGGVAQLYVGKYSKLSRSQRVRCFLRGYSEIPDAKTNHTSLVVRLARMKKLCGEHGFHVVATGTSYKQMPDGYCKSPGGQDYVTLIKKRV